MHSPSRCAQLAPMKLLLVEDDRRLRQAVQQVLREEGYAVDVASDGGEAVELAEQTGYDLLVLDVMLPTLDGFDITRRLRARGSRTPILMLTARDGIPDRVKGLDAGADDYLVKPFALSELLARVRALLRRAAADDTTGDTLEVANLKLNVRSREVERDGRRLELTAKEFALLEMLMRHPNQVLTRTQLLQSVWNDSIEVESNIVDIYIHYLRNKIDREFEPKLIRTVRGAGYALRSG